MVVSDSFPSSNEKHNLELGIGPDVPKVTNEAGGSQSKFDYRFDLVDPLAMFAMARILDQGARTYGVGNWRKIPIEDHINRAIGHLYAHLGGESVDQDDHLDHAMCRVMFALALKYDKTSTYNEPNKNDPPPS